jgi:hypothetical protein
MTMPTDPSSSAPRLRSVPLRLRLNETMGDGASDGCWSPQSRDLSLELADLVDNFPIALGEVRRVVVSRPDWDRAPHRVRVARGLLKVGSYPGDDNHQVWLRASTRRLMRLVRDGAGKLCPPAVRDPCNRGSRRRGRRAGRVLPDR